MSSVTHADQRADRLRFARALSALAGLLVALVLLPVLAGRFNGARLSKIDRPAVVCSEWIQPGSTRPKLQLSLRAISINHWRTFTIDNLEVEENLTIDSVLSLAAPETPLPQPTPGQIDEIRVRLQRNSP